MVVEHHSRRVVHDSAEVLLGDHLIEESGDVVVVVVVAAAVPFRLRRDHESFATAERPIERRAGDAAITGDVPDADTRLAVFGDDVDRSFEESLGRGQFI